jgi:hypothetical protein
MRAAPRLASMRIHDFRFPASMICFTLCIVMGCSSADSGDVPDAEDAATSGPDTAMGTIDTAATSDTRLVEGGADTRTIAESGIDSTVDIDSAADGAADTRPDAVAEVGPAVELVIMPFGDSITGEPHTYREALYTKLVAAGCAVKLVGSQNDVYASIPQKDHEGHPGFTIGDMAKSTDGWLAAKSPKYVLMMIGTNDIAWWYAGTAVQVADAHAKLLDQILAGAPANTWVIAASIPPQSSAIVEPNKYDRATFTTTVNAEIKKRVDSRIAAGKKVRFADVNAALGLGDLRDGIHPTVAGYTKIADVWFRALQPIAGCLGGAP